MIAGRAAGWGVAGGALGRAGLGGRVLRLEMVSDAGVGWWGGGRGGAVRTCCGGSRTRECSLGMRSKGLWPKGVRPKGVESKGVRPGRTRCGGVRIPYGWCR